jgi:hypothetical protein
MKAIAKMPIEQKIQGIILALICFVAAVDYLV